MPISRIEDGGWRNRDWRWHAQDGCGGMLGRGVWGGLVDAGDAEGSPAADFASVVRVRGSGVRGAVRTCVVCRGDRIMVTESCVVRGPGWGFGDGATD